MSHLETKGHTSRAANVVLRLGEVISAAIVLGCIFYLVDNAGVTEPNARLVFAAVIAGMTIIAGLVLMPPMAYTFWALGMGRVTNIIRQLYSPVRQAWKDYKVGRMMRKGLEQLECKGNETQPRPTISSPPRGWQFDRTAEFPWCLQQVVQEESNWRGTWILEVKDMLAMDWGTVRVPNESGRGGKYQRRPTKQLPFTQETAQEHSTVLSDGGQDDLMVWLGKR